MATAFIDTKKIMDWPSFHWVFQKALGFPDFYGKNMNAWIDCLSGLDDGSAMCRFALQRGEMLHIEISNTADFLARLPEAFTELVTCTAFVNGRVRQAGNPPTVALVYLETT